MEDPRQVVMVPVYASFSSAALVGCSYPVILDVLEVIGLEFLSSSPSRGHRPIYIK